MSKKERGRLLRKRKRKKRKLERSKKRKKKLRIESVLVALAHLLNVIFAWKRRR